MKQIRRRFYGLYLIIVVSFVLLMYFILSNVIGERVERQQRIELDNEIVALTEYVEAQTNTDEGIATEETVIQTLDEISPVIHERITFMNIEGDPLYDTQMPVDDLDNLFNYSEIQQVLTGEIIGIANRDSNHSEFTQYYVAMTINDSNNQPVGILRVSNEIRDITESIQYSLFIQIISVVIFAILIIILSRSWINRITDSMTEMKKVMHRLSHSDYDARYTGKSYEEIDELGFSINELATNLHNQQLQLTTSEERIYGLINHLIIGVMLLDENRRIQIVNPVVNELLGTNLYGKITHLYTDYVKSAELIELVEKAYEREAAVNAEIVIYFPEEKILDANIVPVPGKIQGEINYIVLLYDITEIRRLEQIRTDFATNVSHELRTPITALKGFSETLLDGAMYDEEVLTEFLEIMLKESIRLDSMVQDILKLSQLEQKQARASKASVNIRDVTYEVFQILHQKIELKNMTYYIEEKDKNLTIQVNHNQLKQVLMNLIANAITYTPENGTVIVEIEKVNNEAKIQVIDNGIGIPEKDQLRIFERFYRVDKARSRNSGGTGLGLSIVKWVVESMNGRLELYSEVNVGTTFVIWLPIGENRE